MLTVDFDRLGVVEGDRLLDLGCGAGRHTFQALRLGAEVVAADQSVADLRDVEAMVAAMAEEGEIKPPSAPVTLEADALALPFADGHFDRVIAAEILEHIPDDRQVIAELARVLRPGGTAAVSVPRRWTEQICWALSAPYHEVEGGHVRIYRGSELVSRLQDAGLRLDAKHHAHALHSPYWWLKCAVGVDRDHPLTRAYHRMLVWDMMSRPWLTRTAERALDPVLGKSLVLYLTKPAARG
ncbi:class I SAM-dependent methyltransferase [uncultured Jatrophihabitans sp.]|uniref:class I SAM-dependent methyltransferase n=1 Tax=uncultured Jatrophihabitans sp. TaxID=1610747 RepID=UPI0035C9BF64